MKYMVNCIILAGKEESQIKAENKALIDLQGKPMISYVIDALKASCYVENIVVVGDKDQLSSISNEADIIDQNGSILDNVRAGVDYFKGSDMVLISTCDIPLLTGEAVDDFIKKSLEAKADVCYPIINKVTCDAVYPESKRTYASLREGQFTGGNLFMLNPKILDKCIYIAEQMINYRKSPIKMSRVLGLSFLMRFAAGRLTIKDVENRASKLLNIRAKAIISDYAEIGNDVDKPEHVEIIKKYMQKNTRCI